MNFYCLKYCMKRPLTLLFLATLSCFLFLTHRYNSESPSSDNHIARLTRRNTSSDYPINSYYDHREDFAQTNDLISRIDDLKRVKLSISNELRLIEREKLRLLREKASLIVRNEKLVLQINKSKSQLKQLELDISANRRQKFEKSCDIGRVSPIILNPMKSVDIEQLSMPSNHSNAQFHYDLNELNTTRQSDYTFDLSLCSLTKDFRFHLIEPSQSNNDQSFRIDPILARDILKTHRQYTKNISDACLIISFFEPTNSNLLNLDSGKNNLVINLMNSDIYPHNNAAIASSVFQKSSFRDHFDLALPSIWQSPVNYDSIIGAVPPQSPIERKYFASYFGHGGGQHSTKQPSSPDTTTIPYELNPLEQTLQVIHRNSIDDLFLFIYNCGPDSNMQCYEEKEKMIELSTFLIILPEQNHDIDHNINDLIYLALSRGTIPVMVGKERIRLPFDEVIDWRRAAILLHTARLPEIHFILRSISPSDLYQLKYFGRRIFENYLATAKQILDTTISAMSLERFNYPPPPVQDLKTISYYADQDIVTDVNCVSTSCLEAKNESLLNGGILPSEVFGPREKPFASQFYRRNFSLTLTSAYDLWNNPLYSALQLFPSSPIDPIPPSEYKFFSPDQGYRPIGDGLGGSGPEFSRALGGDFTNEQFTIVLLTYERKSMLMRTLERLKGLPYLNKILVVWNGVKHKPAANMVWPDVGVPITIVKVNRNSLNNRFLPYDAIETDAILSLDDDSPLRQDEIVFAFRVWRQSRDRIVGFPGRYHAWDSTQSSWMYNSNHSCELSMVLTGGAFFHKYYSYIYTYNMPEAIRSIVDKFMNCEDIAMNFLVAHLTRKPPIKVTSRWTFHCAGCPSSLSEDDSHFRERHECLNTFASIYGYMPLLSTQHRSDSILFKTRLPHDKQKCFKFV